MVISNGNGNRNGGGSRVSSLRDLPQEVPPPRDLWPSIEASLKEESQQRAAKQSSRRLRPSWTQLAAVAAMVAALAVGILIGRNLLPAGLGQPTGITGAGNQQAQQVGFISDPRYRQQRAALIRSYETELARLPPETRAKVGDSLASIRQSMKEIEAALGRDPGNALLQELLINTYQDEMRVLTTVQEASAREI